MDIFLILLVIIACVAIFYRNSIFGQGEFYVGGVSKPLEKEEEEIEDEKEEPASSEGHATDRTKLPYRPVAECYLVHNGKLVAQDHGHYIMYPGGGIDDGETPEEAGRREVEEEVGIKLDGPLIPITTVEWDWMPEWANNEKRKARYEQFRGERVHFLIGKIKNVEKATSKEGDAWKGEISMSFDKALELHDKYCQTDHPNTKCYRSTQKALINMVRLQHEKDEK
jgi:hypothetical protein